MKQTELMEQLEEAVLQPIKGVKDSVAEQGERLTALEQHVSKSSLGGEQPEVKSLGKQLADSEQFKNFITGGYARSGRIGIKSFAPYLKSAIITDSNTLPLAQRYPTIAAGRPSLRLRDVMTTLPATSDRVEFVRLNPSGGTSNNAASQGAGSSPFVTQNVAKSESAMEFELASQPVETVAHWIPASRQVLDDNQALSNFIDTQMLFWLRQAEEKQLLLGTGANAELLVLVTGSTNYDTSRDQAGDTRIDTLRRCKTQIELAGYSATVAVLHPTDFEALDLAKTSVTSGGMYLIGSPGTPGEVWRLAVVSSAVMTQGDFVVFDGQRGAIIYDRSQSAIEISREHSDFFIRNMVAILAEERICQVIPDALAVVSGTFPEYSPA